MSYQFPFDRAKLRQRLISNHQEIKRALQQDPAFVDYLLNDIELKRKYVKLPEDVENELAERARQLGLGEGILLGLGAVLLLLLLKEIFEYGRR